MPTPYTGDPTAAEPPSPVPQPEGLPIANIPIATEGRTVSSIIQFVKAAFNEIAWLKRPRGVNDLAVEFLHRWRTPEQFTRYALDRLGLPAGTFIEWHEWWPFGRSFSSGDTANQYNMGVANGWSAELAAGVNGIVNITPGSIADDVIDLGHGYAHLFSGGVAGDCVYLTSGAVARFTERLDAAVEFSNYLSASGMASHEVVAGFNGGAANPRDQPGIRFLATPTLANWQASTRDSVGGETLVDTGMPTSSVMRRFRIEYRGGAGAGPKANFFIGGVPVATIAATLPSTAAPAGIFSSTAVLFSLRTTANTGTPLFTRFGPVHFACNRASFPL